MTRSTLIPTDRPKLLIVDDRPENIYVVEKLLSRLDLEIIKAFSGAEALSHTLEHDFCVAIVDIQMPEMDGYEVVELLRSNAGTASLPVIFMSAIFSDEYHHRKAYETGAVDFISKPFIPEILISKVKVFVDLYQQRRAMERANEALMRVNADKDKFFSIISHDLRSPFNTLLGFTRLLEIQAKQLSPDEIEEMARSIHAGAKQAFNLLENLLTWSRLQRTKGLIGEYETLDLEGLVSDSIKVMDQAAAAKDIKLGHAVEPKLFVNADRRMLDTVIRNLTANALKFTQRGGQVKVVAAPDPAVSNGTKYVTIGIQDNGVGMSPEILSKLFRLDVRHSTPGTEQEPGSGLGLIICQEMVDRNGGKIWAESQEGKGTTIWFTVPRAEPGAEKQTGK